MTATVKPYVLPPGTGVPGFGAEVKASGAATGDMLTLIESRTVGGAPRHVHTHEDEYFYVVSGTITVEIGGEHAEVGAGGFVFLPRGIPHSWDTIGEATLLMITTPPMLESFLAEYHAADANRDEIAARYGVTFLK